MASILAVAACDGNKTLRLPTGPGPSGSTYLVTGLVWDTTQRPISDARVEIIAGPLLGEVTTTDGEGRYAFATPIPVTQATTLQVTRDGFRPATVSGRPNVAAIITLTPTDLATLEGLYTVTLQAASACSQIPAGLRSRNYAAAIETAVTYATTFTSKLTASTFQPGYNTFFGSVGADAARISVASWDAFNWWLEDQPIIEQLNPDGHLSIFGTATARLTPSSPSSPITARLDGTWSYCPASASPGGPNWPLTCKLQPLECHSSDHQLTLTRR